MTAPHESPGTGGATPWSIRPAVAADRAGVLALLPRLEAFGLPANVAPGSVAAGEARSLGAAFDALDTLAAMGAALFVAATPAGAITGLLFVETRTDFFTGTAHGHVGVLAVAREAEGSGLGRALLATADAWARAAGYDRLTLHVFEGNARARALYARAGYAPDLVRYRRDLTPE